MKHAQRVWGWPSWSPSGIYTLLLVLLVLTGCASAGTAKQAAPTPTATAVATIPALLPPTTLQKAWGNVTIHALPSALPDNRVFVFLNAATPDGQWLIGANEPRDFIANTTRLSYAVLYNIVTQQMVTMRALLHPQSQILSASADDRWVVWSEADDQPDFFDWTLFAYDRQSGQVRQVGQAALENGKPVQEPAPMPVVDHGKVIWGQPIGPVSPSTLDNAVVRMDDLATGQVTTLATKAGNPYLAWPWVAWGQITSGSNGYVTLKNLETGQSEQLPAQPASLEIAGMSVAYDDTTSVFLINDITQGTDHQQLLATAATVTDHLQYVSLNDRLVAWSQSTVTQVWDRALRRLVVLPVINGESDSWVGGRTLVWLEPEPKAQQDQDTRNGLTPTPTFKVIDTTTLAAAPGA